MSLPSQIVFFKEGQEVKQCPINVGWHVSLEAFVSSVKEVTHAEKINLDAWDSCTAYRTTFTKEELLNINMMIDELKEYRERLCGRLRKK